ncbi:MAG TPA: diacylglycerol kinase family protein [Terriglobales bacterium]|nr:diacylglycerol kinase family protein [Terriglobales bacterium]
MKVAAIYGPRATPDNARPFQEMVSAKWTTTITDDLDAVLIFGGDGTIHRYLPQLSELKIPLLTVPNGSGNDFASGLGIHSEDDALSAFHKFADNDPNVRAIDLGCVTSHEPRATSHLFCNIANLGLDSEINRRANRLPRFLRANGGYVLSLFPSLFSYQPQTVNFTSDGHSISEPATLVAIANGSRYGGGLHIAPKADLSDGVLDVCFVHQTTRTRIATLFPLAYFGAHLRLREVEYFRVRSARIETPQPIDIYADGEFLCQTPADISIIPAGLRVIVPHAPSI